MPRFYLHLHECGNVIEDDEGVDLTDLQTAREAAIAAARDVMRAEISDGRLCMSCCIVISDASHEEVGRVPFREAVTITGL